jgi:outer membrane immunogenic protein
MIHWRYKRRSLGLIMCLLFVSAAVARDVPSGTISLSATSMAAGVGAQWGDGTLTLNNGKTYRFAIQGLEVGGVGFADLHAQGTVYNLRRVSDLDGLYVAADANVAVGSGPGTQTMRNEHGVVINLSSEQRGVKLTLDGQGIRITLKNG